MTNFYFHWSSTPGLQVIEKVDVLQTSIDVQFHRLDAVLRLLEHLGMSHIRNTKLTDHCKTLYTQC